MSVTIKGDKALRKTLTQLQAPRGKIRTMINKSARPGAKIIQQKAKSTAPSSRGTFRTGKKKGQSKAGALIKSIRVRVIPAKSKRRMGATARVVAKDLTSGGGFFYAAPQEYGWYPHGNRSAGRVEGKQFMKRAAERSRPAALGTLRRRLAVELNKFAAQAKK